MHVVALTELVTPIETEAVALAADLGITAYEVRLKLVVGLPAIVLLSADPAPARALLAKIRARGHGALLCDAAEVVPSGAMVPLRRFTFEPDALVAPDVPDASLPYGDIVGIFRALHEARTETLTQSTTKEFSVGRALLSGGVLITKNVAREEKAINHEREQVCYLFRAGGDTPWILRERGTHYAGLGSETGPSSLQNFVATMARLRKLAPGAVYDERLMNARNAPRVPTRTGSGSSETVGVSSASGVDLIAHLMAQWVRGGGRI